ncbi:hypothetical protein PLEOSDRAFT_1075550 [Pleurotus ostreatus PC15]|uniref:Homeobox domain-containing protein n=1 Tax=Pleurotus ostreatus (strain PC15) TaxID=1137138 RepID=A0A067P505_PLEO1|nr:hypothetical protein PLEOSDRAFT_1075550 [Pleurotus ostreatus PC15]
MTTTTLSRTLSATSISSTDTAASTATTAISRRTRRRFNNAQLTILEQLYHQNSHPTRLERDAVAKAGGMESRSVTIWFQNKRQTERRVALHNHSAPSKTKLTSTRGKRPSSPFTTSSSSSRSSWPSLDRVASRSELWAPPPPLTPKRPRIYTGDEEVHDSKNLWDNMPSSPVAPPFSPPARDYVEFGRAQRKRTLEWACAAARLAEKDGVKLHAGDADDTDDELHEAVTPPSTLGAGDLRWNIETGKSLKPMKLHGVQIREAGKEEPAQDDDMMRAALALCGLGRS